MKLKHPEIYNGGANENKKVEPVLQDGVIPNKYWDYLILNRSSAFNYKEQLSCISNSNMILNLSVRIMFPLILKLQITSVVGFVNIPHRVKVFIFNALIKITPKQIAGKYVANS
jgi:hypothetical protein